MLDDFFAKRESRITRHTLCRMNEDEEEYIELSPIDPLRPKKSDEENRPSSTGLSLSESDVRQVLCALGFAHLRDEILEVTLPEEAKFMIQKISQLSTDEAIEIVRETLAVHKDDMNFLAKLSARLIKLLNLIPESDSTSTEQKEAIDESGTKELSVFENWLLQIRIEASLIAYHSPYEEIRAITDPYDDPSVPAETLRAYVIGIGWTAVGAIVNNFFVHKLPSIYLGVHTIQLLLLPSGKLWEKIVPRGSISLMGHKLNFNEGLWSHKEMMFATIMYLCSSGIPYLIYNIVVMKLDRFYGLKWVDWKLQFLLALSTQCLGFGFAGVMRQVCVYPVTAMWPSILPTIALNRALMKAEVQKDRVIHGWKISRYGFFCIAFCGMLLYHWIPTFFFTAMATFNWPTWFSPYLVHLTNIAGFKEGLGLNPLPTLDWNILDSAGCLTYPFYKTFNEYLGSFMAFFVILIVYYTNNSWTGYLPINSNQLFNNKGSLYKVKEILDNHNLFDERRYQNYGPPYFGAANLVLYGAYFCLYPFAILYYSITEWGSMKLSLMSLKESLIDLMSRKKNMYGRYINDPHCKMMLRYDEVPNWWFLVVLLISILFAVMLVIFYPLETPVWAIFLVILVNFIFLIPISAIASMTGFTFGLNVLVELMVGYLIPNSGIALITLKSFGYNIDSQASNYITDQKLAHYTKISPRAIFRGQLITTIMSTAIALMITNWQIDNIEDLCDPHQKDRFSCPGANTYFYSSIQYGAIGPAKVFTGLYPVLKWCFLLGVLLVFPCYWIKKRAPSRIVKYFHPTIIIGGFLDYAPYNLLYYTGGLYFSFFFMYYLKKHYFAWWEKYNYILTSALSTGVAFSSLLIFLMVQNNNVNLDWWGNRVSDQGIEGGHGKKTWLDPKDAPDGYIGLRKGHFP